MSRVFPAVIVAMSLYLASPLLAEPRKIQIAVGEQKILPAGSATKVVAGNPAVLSVKKLDKKRILLFGRSQGFSQITIVRGKRSETITVEVKSKAAGKFMSDCQALLQEPCSFLAASVLGDKVTVTGTVADVEVYHKLKKIRKAFPDLNYLIEVQPRVLDVLVPIINQEFKKAGLKDARVTRIGSRLIIDGQVEDEGQKRRAEIIVQEYYGKVTN